MEKIIFANNQTPALNDTNLNLLQDNVEDALDLKADISSLSAVATSNNYNDLDNKPVIPTNSSFTLSGLSEKSYNSLTNKPTIPSKTSDITNDSGFIDKDVNNLTNYTKTSDLIQQETWLPYISAIEGPVNMEYRKRSGNIIRIGNLVFISFYFKGRITSVPGNDSHGFIWGWGNIPLTVPQGEFAIQTGVSHNLNNDYEDGTTLIVCKDNSAMSSNMPMIKIMNKNGTEHQNLTITNQDFEISGSGCFLINTSN